MTSVIRLAVDFGHHSAWPLPHAPTRLQRHAAHHHHPCQPLPFWQPTPAPLIRPPVSNMPNPHRLAPPNHGRKIVPPTAPTSAVGRLLLEFVGYLTNERGLAAGS